MKVRFQFPWKIRENSTIFWEYLIWKWGYNLSLNQIHSSIVSNAFQLLIVSKIVLNRREYLLKLIWAFHRNVIKILLPPPKCEWFSRKPDWILFACDQINSAEFATTRVLLPFCPKWPTYFQLAVRKSCAPLISAHSLARVGNEERSFQFNSRNCDSCVQIIILRISPLKSCCY